MAGWRLPSLLTFARSFTRGLAWATDIIAMVVLCFIAQRWTETCGAVAPGIVGTAVALLIDSWQMVAFAGESMGFQPMKPYRTLMHDVFSFAVTLGGVVLMLVSNGTIKEGNEEGDYLGDDTHGVHFRKSSMTLLAMVLLGVVIAWRIGFAIWACVDCYKTYQDEMREYDRPADVEEVRLR